MGREIRRVPLDYEYELNKTWPGFTQSCDGCEFKPTKEGKEGKEGEEGEECEKSSDECPRYYDPPEGEGYQIWETVSEGSPVSKVFVTEEELIEYLHTEGATGIFRPCTRAAARHFTETKWACSMAIVGHCSADGINAYSAGIPPFLHGFDCLSDAIIDLLKMEGTTKVEPEINELLLKFRERTDKFTKVFEAAGLSYFAAKKFHGELPDEIQKAVEAYDDLCKKLYGESPS